MSEIRFVELTCFEKGDVEQIDALISQLGPGCSATEQRVRSVVEDARMHLYVAVEDCSGKIVACATLCVCDTPQMRLGFVEAVVVDAAYRGRGIGRLLMEYLVEQASLFAPINLHLTSNPAREAANALYRSLGFQKKETNCYTLPIEL